jgi:hypothetical protein
MRLFIPILTIFLCSCSYSEDKKPQSTISHNENNDESESNESSEYDGSYCAEIDYYNPSTGTHSTYTLPIEADIGEVSQINFPNGGHLDRDHFTGAVLDDDGDAEFTSDKGCKFKVHIIGDEGECE